MSCCSASSYRVHFKWICLLIVSSTRRQSVYSRPECGLPGCCGTSLFGLRSVTHTINTLCQLCLGLVSWWWRRPRTLSVIMLCNYKILHIIFTTDITVPRWRAKSFGKKVDSALYLTCAQGLLNIAEIATKRCFKESIHEYFHETLVFVFEFLSFPRIRILRNFTY